MAGTEGYKPLPRGVRSLSREQMGTVESEKVGCCSFVRRTPDGTEWIAFGIAWRRLDDLEREVQELMDPNWR